MVVYWSMSVGNEDDLVEVRLRGCVHLQAQHPGYSLGKLNQALVGRMEKVLGRTFHAVLFHLLEAVGVNALESVVLRVLTFCIRISETSKSHLNVFFLATNYFNVNVAK